MRHPAGPLLLLLLVAITSRAQVFGNSLVSIDEQFYRLIGHRMLAGALPYVDIWDRKPIGLFLLFAGFAGAGTWSVIVSQLVALAATVATAWLLFVVARRITTRGAALAAASIYIICLTVAGGESVSRRCSTICRWSPPSRSCFSRAKPRADRHCGPGEWRPCCSSASR